MYAVKEKHAHMKNITLRPLEEAYSIVDAKKMNAITGAATQSQKFKNSMVKHLVITAPVFIKSSDECGNIEIIAKGHKNSFTIRISGLDSNMYIY